ncbi:MAG: ATP-binding protein [Lentimicrobiaceae bacterium]|nr:ATP-binding protein [Lentimicrobiaceae bacterium]
MYYQRIIENAVVEAIENFPVTAITGPRQCGKSTLVKHILSNITSDVLYLDLERPSDLQKLDNAEWFLSSQKEKLICIDEIQRRPNLFPLIRSLVDEWNKPGCFIVLGSASRDLLRQSSESLAGRIVYKQLTPFLFAEINNHYTIEEYFERGGFPRSLLSKNDKLSFEWRRSFIATFLERDLLQWVNFTPATMQRIWQMLAHLNGQTVNYSHLGNALGISNQTVKNHIDLLESTFMVYVVPPYSSNMGKRLVKSPKVYVTDAGITASLIGIRSFQELTGHPSFGAIWEQIVLSNIKGNFPEADIFYYRTTNGAEIDFVVKLNNRTLAVECKASFTPILSKGNYLAIEDIFPDHTYVVTPSPESWSMNKKIDVVSLEKLKNDIFLQS